jgi:hypothetical protein
MGVAGSRQAIPCGRPGRHGGNVDHNVVSSGSRVYLPVSVPRALLWIGDVHARLGSDQFMLRTGELHPPEEGSTPRYDAQVSPNAGGLLQRRLGTSFGRTSTG